MSLQAQTALRLVQDNDVDLVPRVTRLGTSISPPPSRRLGTWSRQQRTQRSKEVSLRRLCSRGSVFGEVLGRPAVLCTPAGPTTPMPVPPATAPPNLENPEQESETEDESFSQTTQKNYKKCKNELNQGSDEDWDPNTLRSPITKHIKEL